MNYRDYNSFTILGIGGKGAFYIAKYLLLLGKDLKGFDLKENDRTKELVSLGAHITYSNPDLNSRFDTDCYIYSNDLPKAIQEPIHTANRGLPVFEVGELYHKILEDFEKKELNEQEIKAFKDSNIAPLYDIDTSKMKYIGVTGTDGKTTTCTMIYHMLKNIGFKPALITTVSAKIGDEDIDTGFHTTTPTSQELFNLIKKAQEAECTHLVLETTSHALVQGRVMGLKFDAVVYTNITEEHLDYHKNWESLANAKSLLIRNHSKQDSIVILNKDDGRSYGYLKDLHQYKDYSIESDAVYMAKNILEGEDSLNFDLCRYSNCEKTLLPILGRYNVSNFLAACGIVCELESTKIKDCAEVISDFETIRGRMQIVQKSPFIVIVDYAHTPNALENALQSARKLTKGKVIHVFGSAGQRDFYKRPVMGKISNDNSDITILTAEDPRLESLKDINDQIEEGWKDGNNVKAELIRFDDDTQNIKVRRDAISKALELATEGDVVIITGKAHETSLCFVQTEYPWNDIEEVKELLNN